MFLNQFNVRIYTEKELEILLDISNDLDLIRLISKKELLIDKKNDLCNLNSLINFGIDKCIEEVTKISINGILQDYYISDRVNELLKEDKQFKDLYDLNFNI